MPTPLEIQTCIDNLNTNSDPSKFTVLAAETSNANTGISFSVATIDDLPDLETSSIGSGQIVFVESIGVPVISTDNEWKGLDGRLLRCDFIIRSLFMWGCNLCGMLGDGTTVDRCSPVREFCSATNWCQISSTGGGIGQLASAIKTSGELWSWGVNCCGVLGDGTTVNRCSPVREFFSATDWCQVSVGGVNACIHAAAIKTSGELWSWGRGSEGRLGTGTTVTRCSAVREFCSATNWCQVSAGGAFSTAIKTSGELWSWGFGSGGRLGDGASTSRCSPVREICSATDWCQVSAGAGVGHVSAIKTSGELWSWGANNYGLTATGIGASVGICSPVREFCSAIDWCQVSAGACHKMAVKTSGELWGWGVQCHGRLGTGIICGFICSPVRERCSATNWCQVSAGFTHGAAVKTSGELWAWGLGGCGVLGDGTNLTRCSPVREIFSATDWCQVSAGCNQTGAIRIK